MNAVSELAENVVPSIVVLSVWWAFLSTLEVLLTPHQLLDDEPPPEGGGATGTNEDRLAALKALDPAFSVEAFLGGARGVYEAVLRAYAQGDVEALRPLLSADVLDVFAASCAGRAARGETLEMTLLGIDGAEIAHVWTQPDATEIAVLFRGRVTRVERSASGDVVGGDPEAVATTGDLWTFARPASTTSAEWLIVATDEI
ncbi:MAG: Tim44 domain-containing protein [Rhizobiales bacterium]|nr:Tim44 domain-containing protein [Hyphomicrobiales bacterium]OJU37598.1 MAG: hypothetical protein BGN94_22965 [Rhizobiales bacterium 68-8]